MNRALIATVMGMALMGCAVSADDPLPAPEQQQPGKDPPAETFSAQLRQPASQFEIVIQDSTTTQIPTLEKQIPNLPSR